MGLSLWREDGSVVYNCCWPSPAQSFSGRSPVGLVTIFYNLIFETSLFVASYDSQGYSGDIRPRLHTGIVWKISRCSLYRLASIQGNPCKWFIVTKSCLLKRRLLSNRGSIVDCVTSRMYLTKRCLAMYCSSFLSRKKKCFNNPLACNGLFRHKTLGYWRLRTVSKTPDAQLLTRWISWSCNTIAFCVINLTIQFPHPLCFCHICICMYVASSNM
jgi:hypothetical protein